jgi:hypothetical protein
MNTPNVKEVVRDKYGQAALRVTSGAGNACCRDDHLRVGMLAGTA